MLKQNLKTLCLGFPAWHYVKIAHLLLKNQETWTSKAEGEKHFGLFDTSGIAGCPIWWVNDLITAAVFSEGSEQSSIWGSGTLVRLNQSLFSRFHHSSCECNIRRKLSTVHRKLPLIHHTAKKEADSSWKKRLNLSETDLCLHATKMQWRYSSWLMSCDIDVSIQARGRLFSSRDDSPWLLDMTVCPFWFADTLRLESNQVKI